MGLTDALKNPYLSKDKEELFTYRLFYEIKKVGLQQGIDFELLEPVIDKNGYDVLIKHHTFTKPIQLKCSEQSTSVSWKINKRFFRPVNINEGKTILRNATADYAGLGGGVLLIEYTVNEKDLIIIKYFYCDFVCLSFFQRSVRPWTLSKNYIDFVREIFDDTKRRFNLPKSLFFEVTVEQFLFLARILPVKDDLTQFNAASWFYHYPPLEEISAELPKLEEKKISVLLRNGKVTESKIELSPIFDLGLRKVSINKKIVI